MPRRGFNLKALLCCFGTSQPRRGGQVSPLLEDHHEIEALRAQIDRLTSQQAEDLHILEEFAYQRRPLQQLNDTLSCLDDQNPIRQKLYQITHHLLSDLEQKQDRISALSGDVLRLADTQLESIRDDYHFTTKFGRVFRGVEEWVYLTFLDADIEQQLEEEAVNLFRKQAGEDWQGWWKEEHFLLLTSVVMEVIVSKVLELPVIGMRDNCCALFTPDIETSLINNTDEDIKWRAKTINILTRSQLFWEAFQPTPDTLVHDLLTMFSFLSPKNTTSYKKRLTTLIKEGASVALECQKEPSQFQFRRFAPGSKCKGKVAKMVSDARNEVKDQELEEVVGKWAVAMTVAPAVLRVAYGTGEEVVVLKAKVLLKKLAHKGNGEGGGSEDAGSSEDGESTDESGSGEEEGSSEEEEI